jgi:hypothetical protein
MRIPLLLAASLLAGCTETLPSPSDPATPAPAVQPGPYTAGQSYFGRNDYVEYLAGNAPVILTAPHGGSLLPAEIPDRTCGTTVTDSNTREAVLAMRAEFFRQTGRYPHVVVNHLRRLKMDPNRDRAEATCGDAEADTAWAEYHAYIDSAKAAVTRTEGRGWYLDYHGHGHDVQRLELGYLLSRTQVNLSDAQLDANVALEDSSSIHTISHQSPLSFSALLRGSTSLGTLYASEGFPSVPSAGDPSPGTDAYFSGGYSTERHTCAPDGGVICGVQIEANYTGVRDTDANRKRFAVATAHALNEYLHRHYDIRVTPIALRTRGYTSGGNRMVELKWIGATGATVELRRDGALVSTVDNDGAYVNNLGKRTGTFDYRLCNVGTTVCSNLSSVTF